MREVWIDYVFSTVFVRGVSASYCLDLAVNFMHKAAQGRLLLLASLGRDKRRSIHIQQSVVPMVGTILRFCLVACGGNIAHILLGDLFAVSSDCSSVLA